MEQRNVGVYVSNNGQCSGLVAYQLPGDQQMLVIRFDVAPVQVVVTSKGDQLDERMFANASINSVGRFEKAVSYRGEVSF